MVSQHQPFQFLLGTCDRPPAGGLGTVVRSLPDVLALGELRGHRMSSLSGKRSNTHTFLDNLAHKHLGETSNDLGNRL